MQGAFDQNIFQNIKFNVYLCTSDKKCLSNDQIKDVMGRGFIGIYFLDYAVNTGNYLVPFQPQPREVFTNFDLNSQKEIDILLRNQYIFTEDGIVFREANPGKRLWSFSSSSEFNFNQENENFLVINFKVKQEKGIYERNYTKIQEVLAQIGGFINCFWLISMFLNYLYSNLFVICKIIENVFVMKVFHEIKNNPNIKLLNKNIFSFYNFPKKQTPICNENGMTDTTDIEKSGFPKLNFSMEKKNQTEAPENKIQQKQNIREFEVLERLDMNILDYVYYYNGLFKAPDREKKKMIITKGYKILRQCLDIKYIIEKFYEIEEMKQILLTDKEREAFGNLPKPELRVEIKETN